jgi:hypothetical protein
VQAPVAPFGFTGFWPQMASKFETEAVSYVTTLLHTINPTTFLEATAGVNWGYQWASPFNQAALDANNRARCFPTCRSSSPRQTRWTCCRTRRSQAGFRDSVGPDRLFPIRTALSFPGYTTIWDFSGSLTKV